MRSIRFINPLELAPTTGYSHVAIAGSGRTVHVSGQVAFDAYGTVVGTGDLEAQTVQVFENLRAALASAGGSLADVVKMTIFVKELTAEKAQVVRNVRATCLPDDHRPASTMVGVTGLVHEDLLVEIEVTALLPEAR